MTTAGPIWSSRLTTTHSVAIPNKDMTIPGTKLYHHRNIPVILKECESHLFMVMLPGSSNSVLLVTFYEDDMVPFTLSVKIFAPD